MRILRVCKQIQKRIENTLGIIHQIHGLILGEGRDRTVKIKRERTMLLNARHFDDVTCYFVTVYSLLFYDVAERPKFILKFTLTCVN